MKFVWDVAYKEGYENTHTIICGYEGDEVNPTSDFNISLVDDNDEIITTNVNLVYYVNGVETEFVEGDNTSPCISGELPSGVIIKNFLPGNFRVSGSLPIINEDTKYYFTLRARVEVTNEIRESQGIPEDVEYLYDDMFMSIFVNNRKLSILSNLTPYEFTETLYNKFQLELINAEGNEEFVKISGELPNGISLSYNGLIYGIAYEDEPTSHIYKCLIGVRRNGEIILTKEIETTVIKLSSLKDPIWITDAGQIASLNYDDIPDSSLFVKAYDPNGLMLTYEKLSGYDLPDGLNINRSTGQIYGRCNTKETKIWSFKVRVSNGTQSVDRMFKIETNKVSVDRYIKWLTPTNLGSYKIGDSVFLQLKAESNYNVYFTLLSNTLPEGLSFNNGLITGKIKYQQLKTYYIAIEASNGYNSIQEKFIMKLEKGLGKNALKCYFYINHEYDDDYTQMLSYFNRTNAYEPRNALYKINSIPEIDVCECNCFDKELMKHLLDYNKTIDITWGKTIRKDYYNNDNILYTVFYKDIQENLPTSGYQVWGGDKIYVTEDKEIKGKYYLEGTTTEVIPTGDVYKDNNSIIKGKPYVKYAGKTTYIKVLTDNDYYIPETKEIVDENEPKYVETYEEYNIYTFQTEILYKKYVLRNDEKVYLKQCENGTLGDIETNTYLGLYESEADIKYSKDKVRYYFIDNKRTALNIPSINEIRKSLDTKVVVEKLDNEHVYYDPGSQEIISETDFENKYVLYYDEMKESYYVKYDGKPVYLDVYGTKFNETDESKKPVYAWVKNNNWIDSIDNKDAAQEQFDDTWDNRYADTKTFSRIIDGNATEYVLKPIKVLVDFLDTEVDYQSYLIFEKGTQNLQENILFTLDWYPYTKFIILNGVTHIVEEVSNPWIYNPELNPNFGIDKRLVLPYINDEDVNKLYVLGKPSGYYIKFFDMDSETLPEWKVRTVQFYEVDKYYYAGDIFKVETKDGLAYFKVKATFKSGENYEDYQESYLTPLDEDTVKNYLKPYYYPTLPLFYAKPYTEYGDSGSILPAKMEEDEANGKLLTGRKFCFFEVHFSPLYNNNIDNFTIDFYNHNNDRSPEFQLI